MQVREIMTESPKCAEPSTPLQQIAQMMIECDCGGIPICTNNKLVGFVTDRDIVCRILAKDMNPLQYKAQDAMTTDLHTITPDMSVDEVVHLMQRFKVRRAPVVNQQGQLVGIVAQADILRKAVQRQPEMMEEVEETVATISEPKSAM